ncbi:hypothetical protein V498_04016 [Pseudogymnoascus sp. VKM F-4517 (FW-2822)]|nr:hypothetical protein V498_04016 [Pseudogymnoascus sp. VKM F-4517 (FW-2822)]
MTGFQCDDCDTIVVSKDAIQKHCKIHGWFYSKEDPAHWKLVKVQTFFGTGFQKYFIVASEEQESISDIEEDEDALLRDQLLRDFAATDEQDKGRLEIADSKTEKSDNTGWWNFVQWRPHFGSRNIRRIAHASRLPDRKDKQLQRAGEIVNSMVKGAVDGLSSLNDDTPYWLRTANSTEKVENRPMVRLQNEDSLDRYIAYLKRFACYLLRVYVAQKEREALERDVDMSDEELVDNNEEFLPDIVGERGGTHETANSEQRIRREVAQFLEDFPFTYDHSTVELPRDGSAPQPVIPVVDGFQCRECPFKSCSRKVVRVHWNEVHDRKRLKDEELFRFVRLQTWFRDSRERYWVVDEGQGGSGGDSSASITVSENGEPETNSGDEETTRNALKKTDSQQLLEQLKQEYQQYNADDRQRRLQLAENIPPTENDTWLHFTKWNGVLSASNHDIRKTYHFVRKPETTEVDLERVLQAWDRIVNRCLDTLGDVDNVDILKWLQSPRQEEPASRPFRLPQAGYTLVKYGGLWHHFLCYVFRTAPDDEWEESTETGVWYTPKQRKSIRQIRGLLRSSSDGRFDEFTEPEERDAKLTEELMGFCLMVVRQDLEREKVYRSPLMHFLAVMGIDAAAGTLRGAFTYTPTLAAALWINRLLMLEMAVSLKGWRGLKIPAKEDISSVKDRVDMIRRKYLCLSSYTPTSSILSQLAMGRKLNKAYGRPPNIHWADEDTIVYRGMPIPLAKLQLLAEGVIAEAEEALHELTFGGPLPDIDLSLIADPLIGTSDSRKSGYSLFHNESIQKLKTLDLMLERSVNAPKDQRLYERGPNGAIIYNDRNVKNYLAKEKRGLRKLMVAMQVASGQPARKPELGSIKIRASVYSVQNIRVINGRMAIITEYDKSRSIRGVSHYVVRFLPDRLGQVLMKYIAYIDPFARPLPMDRRSDEFLFSGPSGPWTGIEGTEALIEATNKYLGVRLTWGAWRQVAIGFKDWLLYKEMKVFKEEEKGDDDEDDEEEFESMELNTLSHVMDRQSAHSSRTARAHYAVDSNFLSGLRPALIHAYETASLAWHNMLGVGSAKDTGLKGSKHKRSVSDVLCVDENKKTRPGRTRSSQKVIKEDDDIDIAENIQTGLTKLFGPQGAWWMLRLRGHGTGTRRAHGNRYAKTGVGIHSIWIGMIAWMSTGQGSVGAAKKTSTTVMSDRASRSHVSTLML